MRILYVATIGGFMPFFKTFIRELLDEGHEVDIATNMTQYPLPDYYKDWGCGIYQISCSRSPLSKGNINCVKEIKKIVSDKHYDIVHCHTPIASVCARIACRNARKHETKVIYTSHGFHFYKGAPLKNWLIYYPIEKICSYFTDVLITINTEDYDRALSRFKAKNTIYVPGVGIDNKKFNQVSVDQFQKREAVGIPSDSFLIVSVGELNQNKNHSVVIRAIYDLKDPKIHYAIAGEGEYRDNLQQLIVELGLESQIHLLGYRNDIPELYACADLCAFPSIREGQGIAALEGMAAGLPLVASDNRGMRGILVDKQNALICKYDDVSMFSKAIDRLVHDTNLRTSMGVANRQLSKRFDIEVINKQMQEIYSSLINAT